MKRLLMIMMALLVAIGVSAHTGGGKKEMRVLVVTTTPEMHCQNCEKKIKENIRFEPGVKKIVTSLEKQQVTITYNPAKTDVKKLTEAFAKIGYEVKVLSDQPVKK
jgi:copper chaperone CopZ